MIRLRELREARDLSVKDMCRKLGVDDSRYRKWESGKNGLPLEYSLMCCDILHCSLDELSGRTAAIEYDSSAVLSCEHAVSGPLGTRLGRKKAAPTHGDGLPRWPKPWRGRIIS